LRKAGIHFSRRGVPPGQAEDPVLKLTLVPLFMFIVSTSGQWWGPLIAGWLAGLPVVAGPIVFLLTLEHGPDFGAHAATLSLSAILASEAFNFGYAWTCRSHHWSLALTVGFAAWLVAAFALVWLPSSPAYAVAIAMFATAFGQTFLPRAQAEAKNLPLTKRDLIGRMIAGAVLTCLVTTLASSIGPKWSGVLAVFPLIGSVLSVSSHRAHGPDFVVSLLRGMVLGRFSFATFFLCLTFTLPRQATAPAFLEAAALALFVQWLTKGLADRSRLRRAPA
jgi:hypothetical protein